MNDDDNYSELQVTLTFTYPIRTDDGGLRDKALALRDAWIEEPRLMVSYLGDVEDDFDLQVKTPSEP